ncbi:hypothetical protein Tco_0156506 [Tanacetum coccineum]
MTTPVEKRNANKFCEFHGEVGHNTDECNHLRKQIEDMLKAGKLSHIIRELKQNSGKEQPKKKGETSGKEKPQEILMIQSRQKTDHHLKYFTSTALIDSVRKVEPNGPVPQLRYRSTVSVLMESLGRHGAENKDHINNARNDKVPGYGRNTYAKK